jgi:hypothetical protein
VRVPGLTGAVSVNCGVDSRIYLHARSCDEGLKNSAQVGLVVSRSTRNPLYTVVALILVLAKIDLKFSDFNYSPKYNTL